MTNFGLPEKTINELLKYFSTKNDIEKVLIFGSRAKDTYKTGSDIDFAIWTDNHKEFFKISSELDDLPTPYKFDIVDYKRLEHTNMKHSIDTEGILFYEK